MSKMKTPTFQDILEARTRIQKHIKETAMDDSRSATSAINNRSSVYFKYENLQRTGSFKIRGAANKILSLSAEEKSRGVIACSAGNHAQGVALSAQWANSKATVVMPETASLNKINATESYGAKVILHGQSFDEAQEKARELEKKHNYTFVHPFEDPLIVAGQGTLGIEILEQIPDLDSVIVAVGGGGLISGLALAIKSIRPECKVIGVQTEKAPQMVDYFNKSHLAEPLTAPAKRIFTLADGIAVRKPSEILYQDLISKHVDEMLTVTEDEIAHALVFTLERTKNLIEGAAAAAVAALLFRKLDLGKKTCALLCGGNVDLNLIAKVIERGLKEQGRLADFSVVVDDSPGKLRDLAALFALERANILQVHHDRLDSKLSLRETRIDFLAETSGLDHVAQIQKALLESGARLRKTSK